MSKVYGPHGGQGCPTALDGLGVPEGYEVFQSGSDAGTWYFSAIADSATGYHKEGDALEGVCAHAQRQRDIGAQLALQELIASECVPCRMGWVTMETENGGQLHVNDGGYYHCNASWNAVLMLQRYDK